MTNAEKNEDFASKDGHRQRLRSRYAAGGIASLADYERVELLLTYFVPRIDVKPVAKSLLHKFGNIRGIIDAPVEELRAVKGIGESSALGISLLKNLITLYHENELVCFDAKLKIIPNGSVRIFEGSVSSTSIDVRKIIETAIKHGAASIAVAHNHPSGDPTPSLEDIRLTMRLSEACKPIHLSLIEHVVVGKKACFSFRRDGRFDCLYDESLMEGRLRGACREPKRRAAK